MNRSTYYNYIEEKLNLLAYRIKGRVKLNLLDLNIHSETFFADLMNIIFNYKLKNLNESNQNIPSIDLIDVENKIIIQVSSTASKQKIENSLKKSILLNYEEYNLKFMFITEDTSSLKKNTFKNPFNILFSPQDDIIDINLLLKKILNKSIEEQMNIYNFIQKELGETPDINKIETNLAAIIDILSKENLSQNLESPEINSFKIAEKIEFNKLLPIQETINDYKIYYHRLDEIYSEFDKLGYNKSFSVLQMFKRQYNTITLNKNKPIENSNLFYEIIDNIINIIKKSKNYKEIEHEELIMCVDILAVDAFIRCKTFENPEGYNHVITR